MIAITRKDLAKPTTLQQQVMRQTDLPVTLRWAINRTIEQLAECDKKPTNWQQPREVYLHFDISNRQKLIEQNLTYAMLGLRLSEVFVDWNVKIGEPNGQMPLSFELKNPPAPAVLEPPAPPALDRNSEAGDRKEILEELRV